MGYTVHPGCLFERKFCNLAVFNPSLDYEFGLRTLAFFLIWNLKVHNCAMTVAYKTRRSVHFKTFHWAVSMFRTDHEFSKSVHKNAWTWNGILIWPLLTYYFTLNACVHCWMYQLMTLLPSVATWKYKIVVLRLSPIKTDGVSLSRH